MSKRRGRRKRKRDDDEVGEGDEQPLAKKRKVKNTSDDEFQQPSQPARRHASGSSSVQQLREAAAKGTPFPGRTTDSSVSMSRQVVEDDSDSEEMEAPEVPEVVEEEVVEELEKYRTPQGPRITRSSLSASEMSAYSVYSSYTPASFTSNVIRYSTVALIWIVLVISLYWATYKKFDPSVPNGRPYCQSEDAWEGRMSITFEGVDCQVCPLKKGWYCESPRLVRCDQKFYDVSPIGAICGKREEDDWKWALEKIGDLRKTLRVEKGKAECGCEDAVTELCSCSLKEDYYNEWLGDQENTEELKEEFETKFFALFMEVLKRSSEHFEINVEEFDEDVTDEEGSTKRVKKNVFSSTVAEHSFGCSVKLFFKHYQLAFYFMIFLLIAYGVMHYIRVQNAKFEQNVADLASMVLTRLKLGKDQTQKRVVDVMKEEIRRVEFVHEIDVEKLWPYVEEIVDADNRIFVDCNDNDEKVWQWNGIEDEAYDSPEVRRKSMVTPQKISPKYTTRKLFRKSIGSTLNVTDEPEEEEEEGDILNE